MANANWVREPVEVVQDYDRRHGKQSELAPLLLWAVWAVEGLFYLEDLDEFQVNSSQRLSGHYPNVIDSAHVRWATGTSITSIDLCAAALGRLCCGYTGQRKLDLNGLLKPKYIKHLPLSAFQWTQDVLSDGRYQTIHRARNPFTNQWLGRTSTANGSSRHSSRTQFEIVNGKPRVGSRNLILDSRSLAFEGVNNFVQMIDTM